MEGKKRGKKRKRRGREKTADKKTETEKNKAEDERREAKWNFNHRFKREETQRAKQGWRENGGVTAHAKGIDRLGQFAQGQRRQRAHPLRHRPSGHTFEPLLTWSASKRSFHPRRARVSLPDYPCVSAIFPFSIRRFRVPSRSPRRPDIPLLGRLVNVSEERFTCASPVCQRVWEKIEGDTWAVRRKFGKLLVCWN